MRGRRKPAWVSLRIPLAVFLHVCALLPARNAGAAQPPVYTIEPAPPLCARAADPDVYDTGFLRMFTHLVQGRDDWLFRTDQELIQRFGPDEQGYRDLGRLAGALRARGVQLVLVYLPPKGLVHPSKILDGDYDFATAAASYGRALDRLRRLGIVVPDLTALLDEHGAREFYFRRDHHWTPYGARRTARLVAAAIRNQPGWQKLEHREFITRRVGLLAKYGTLQKAALQICGQDHALQYVDEFATSVAGEEEDLLLDGGGEPRVVLVGTSFSRSAYNYNFAGFLRQDLEADVLNNGVAGAGFDGALLQYLASASFRDNPPLFLIWEVPGYYPLQKPMFVEQALALLQDGCAGRQPLLQRTVTLGPGSNEVLFNGGGRILPITGRDFILDMRFSKSAPEKIRARLWYMNGRREKLTISHSRNIDLGGRFTFEFSRHHPELKSATLLAVDLEAGEDEPAGRTVTTTLCRAAGTSGDRQGKGDH